MGRRSLAAERKRQILDAFERCVIKYGLESASLDDVAKEAGVSRSIIRHYLGNRDRLFDELVDRITADFLEHFENLFRDVRTSDIRQLIIDSLFTYQMGISAEDVIIVNSLLLAKDRYPSAKAKLIKTFENILDLYVAELGRLYPASSPEARRSVAYALFTLSLSHESMVWLGMDTKYMEQLGETIVAMIDSLSP
jgi:AcrR family transcriptional regulator